MTSVAESGSALHGRATDTEEFFPGSAEAVENGCTCPVGDNARGRGAWGTSGDKAVFWIAEDCPLHGPASD